MELIELISIRIDEVRSQRGQDITELARRAGIKNKTLWKTLHGNRTRPFGRPFTETER